MRVETKYLVSLKDFYYLKEILPLCFKRDQNGGDEGYLVTSLYYDTLDLKAYYDKAEGELHKTKWRLRMYDHDHNSIHLEEKIKQGRLSQKNIYSKDSTGHLHLQPKLLVEYKRLAFECDNLRVTLDYDLLFAKTPDLFGMIGKPENLFVFEIKDSQFTENPIVDKIVHDLNLSSTAFSKYSYGMKVIYDL